MLGSYGLSEMIAKLSRPFLEMVFIKNCMLKAGDVLCPEKIFEGVSLAENTVASRVDELATNTYELLTSASKEFHLYSIAIDESTCRLDTAFCAVF